MERKHWQLTRPTQNGSAIGYDGKKRRTRNNHAPGHIVCSDSSPTSETSPAWGVGCCLRTSNNSTSGLSTDPAPRDPATRTLPARDQHVELWELWKAKPDLPGISRLNRRSRCLLNSNNSSPLISQRHPIHRTAMLALPDTNKDRPTFLQWSSDKRICLPSVYTSGPTGEYHQTWERTP